MSVSSTSKYCFIIPGKGYSPRAKHARSYKNKIRGLARKKMRYPIDGEVQMDLEYLYWESRDRLDGDNLLKTICDALNGIAYGDDSQVVDHRVKLTNVNSSFTIKGVPLTQQIADLFGDEEPFVIIRLCKKVR